MDNNNMNQPNQYPDFPYAQNIPVKKTPADSLISMSYLFGICAILSAVTMTIYFPFILGGISIIFALLSKGMEKNLAKKAKIGIACSIVGLVLNVCIVVGSVYTVLTNEEMFNQFNTMYEQIYGESFTDMYEDAYGTEFPFS